jgi:hypothetical protein
VKIDPRSDRIALHYTGSEAGEPAISGVPARDLTENDVDRLVFVEHGELKGAARQASVDKLLDRLTDGPYRRTPAPVAKPKAKAKKAAAAPSPAPAGPAPAPAEPSATSAEGAEE